jgi:tRNA G46 methylase TrmB
VIILQNIDRFIKETCKKEKIDIKKLPFKLDEYRLTTDVSTFLDIGSGFGKPNFHAAMQVFPKESIGIEIVPARVAFTLD